MNEEYKVLVSAYACEPNGGSEATIGWKFVNEIAVNNKVWVITRESNKGSIERIEQTYIHPNIRWLYFDYPPMIRFWKRGARGLRLYYYLWQIGIYFKLRKINKEINFDIVHHVTFVNYWLPSFLSFLPVPFIWGPVGGGESVPYQLYKNFSLKHKIFELLRNFGQAIHAFNPILRFNAKRTTLAIAANNETADKMRKIGYKKLVILSQVAIDDEQLEILGSHEFKNSDSFRFYSVGRLIPLKGLSFAIRAFYDLSKKIDNNSVEYLIIGDGEQKGQLSEMIRNLNLTHQVKLLGFKKQPEVFEIMKTCDVLVFPSLHDSGGLVVTEALAAGKPVICLDTGGPGFQVTRETGIKIPVKSQEQITHDLEMAMRTLYENRNLRYKMGNAGRESVRNKFTWIKKAEIIQKHYDQIYEGRFPG